MSGLPAGRRLPWGQLAAYAVVLVVLCICRSSSRRSGGAVCVWMAIAIAACGSTCSPATRPDLRGPRRPVRRGGVHHRHPHHRRRWPFPAAMAAQRWCPSSSGRRRPAGAADHRASTWRWSPCRATLFPLAVEQFRTSPVQRRSDHHVRRSCTGARSGTGASSSSRQADWRRTRKYFIFRAITIVCFVLTRNLVRSRMGRALVAVRDNRRPAEVSGVPRPRSKILTFGLSSALAGSVGRCSPLNAGEVRPSSFTIFVSIYFLVAVVVAVRPASVGPAIRRVFFGVFTDSSPPSCRRRISRPPGDPRGPPDRPDAHRTGRCGRDLPDGAGSRGGPPGSTSTPAPDTRRTAGTALT